MAVLKIAKEANESKSDENAGGDPGNNIIARVEVVKKKNVSNIESGEK